MNKKNQTKQLNCWSTDPPKQILNETYTFLGTVPFTLLKPPFTFESMIFPNAFGEIWTRSEAATHSVKPGLQLWPLEMQPLEV